jgi:hypothetical protein
VFVGVIDGVGVFDGVIDGVGVFDGVNDIVGVLVGVIDGVGGGVSIKPTPMSKFLMTFDSFLTFLIQLLFTTNFEPSKILPDLPLCLLPIIYVLRIANYSSYNHFL